MKQQNAEKLISGTFQNIEFFDGFSPLKKTQFLDGATKHFAAHRQHVIQEGDEAEYFILVLGGTFKLIKKIGDHNAIFDFAVRNDLVGALLMSDSRTFPISVASIGLSEYLRIPKETYLNYWTRDPEMMTRVQKATARRMEALHFSRLLQDLTTEKKMAGLFLRLTEKSKANSKNLIEIPLTRKDLAEAIGARVETAIRVISQWQKQGIIEYQNRILRIKRPDLLAKIFHE